MTHELVYVMQRERLKARVGGGEDIPPIALRATMIFRPEHSENAPSWTFVNIYETARDASQAVEVRGHDR